MSDQIGGARAKARYRCGTPKIHCNGNIFHQADALVEKSHSSRDESFRCYKKYLVDVEGYTQIGGREFRKEGHPVRVLTKKMRFGARLRPGKEGRVMMEGVGPVIVSN